MNGARIGPFHIECQGRGILLGGHSNTLVSVSCNGSLLKPCVRMLLWNNLLSVVKTAPTGSTSVIVEDGLNATSYTEADFPGPMLMAHGGNADRLVLLGNNSPKRNHSRLTQTQFLAGFSLMPDEPLSHPAAPVQCDSSRRGDSYFDASLNKPCFCDGSVYRSFDGANVGTSTNCG
jgi:hypothetical protein